ncbi:Fibronectin type III domain-containing protein [Streptosporangium subroseum]|uniref:Fibronectin type III domain-containing protein n=1 Tax=Streptosporangium subroseum TaxID=106412 RepID=A0A239GFL0_9ACTN|nr:cellulose binding domain-containing protein [Streptosporangium subroseum]SNS67987.1 Fibronectin type III domain-containing protein [Streptosporangium subroseum]
MRFRRTLTAVLAALGVSLGLSTVAAPAFAAPPTAVFTKVSDWGSGFEGKYTVTNGGTTTLNGWSVAFDLPSGANIGSFWDAAMSRSGQRFTFTNVGWNGTLAPGATASFGFNGSPGGITPSNCTLNGASCAGGTPPNPGTPGTPGAPSVTGTTNSSISLSWGASSGTVTGYRVYEGTTQRAQVTGTSTTVGSLGTCTSHTYTVKAYNAQGESAASASASATTTGCTNPPPGGKMAGAPYLYMGWGNPPNPATVMSATGVKSFTMAFILSSGGCVPAWDGNRPLTGGADAQAISQIKAAGGSVQVSFGGWSGNKLGPNCSTPAAFAGAVQQVINAVGPAVVDFDIENTDEFENYTVQDRILNGLKIVKQNNPNVKVVVTFGTSTTGPTAAGIRLINQAKALAVPIDNYTIMPFDFGGGANMYQSTVNASEGLKNALKAANGWTDAQAYSRMGISGMNGLSDQQELTSPATWTQITNWAKSNGLTRLAYWAVNRDRPCPGGGVTSNCSGISQIDWEFTRITAGF